MAIGFSDSPEKPLLLALELHKDLSRDNTQKTKERDRLYLRIGLDSGPVYIIEDLNGKENVWVRVSLWPEELWIWLVT